MKRIDLIKLCGQYACFDRAFLRQMSGENDGTLDQSIKRWLADGTLLGLRNGMYTLAEPLRKAEISLPSLANELYPPSYLTGIWALSFRGLIPDVAREFTSATPRRPQRFQNDLGVFSYRHMSAKYFWGFESVRTGNAVFRCATSEKALVDHWYWTPGEWTEARMRELRLQNLEQLDGEKLSVTVRRVSKPRILRAYICFCEAVAGKEET